MDRFIEGNQTFARTRFVEGLTMRPSLATIVIGCLDPRVDPAVVLGAEQGQIAVIRNVGGRVTPHTLLQLRMLGDLARNTGRAFGFGLEIVVLQHTNCGITLMRDRDLLNAYFQNDLPVNDPHAAVAYDVAALRAETWLDGAQVSGLVYDVTTGLVEAVNA